MVSKDNIDILQEVFTKRFDPAALKKRIPSYPGMIMIQEIMAIVLFSALK